MGKNSGKRKIQISLWKIILVILLIISGIIIFKNRDRIDIFRKSEDINSNQTVQTGKNSNTQEDSSTTVSLVMVGDNLIHSSIYKDAKRLAGGNGYDFKPIIEYIKEKVQNYDLAYYNQ